MCQRTLFKEDRSDLDCKEIPLVWKKGKKLYKII